MLPLQWDLFRLPELDCFQAMLNRLYRSDAEQIVMNYEKVRNAMQQEIERREMEIKKATPEMKGIDNRNVNSANLNLGNKSVPGKLGSVNHNNNNNNTNDSRSQELLNGHYSNLQEQLSYSAEQKIKPSALSKETFIKQMPPKPMLANVLPKSVTQPMMSVAAGPSTLLPKSFSNVLPVTCTCSSYANNVLCATCRNILEQHGVVGGKTNGNQIPLGKTVSSTSMTSGHGSALELSSSNSSLFSLSMSGSHAYLATSNSSLHSSLSSLAPQVTSINGITTPTAVGSSVISAAPNPLQLAPGINSFATISQLFSAEEETKV